MQRRGLSRKTHAFPDDPEPLAAVQSLNPEPFRDVGRRADGRWTIQGPRPLIVLTPEGSGAAPAGDVRLEIAIATDAIAVHATLVIDVGGGFAAGRRVPLPVPRDGWIRAVIALPPTTVGLALDPGPVGPFALGASRCLQLSGPRLFWEHFAPQLVRLVRHPSQGVVMLGRALRLLRYRGPRGVVERLRRGTQRQLAEEGYQGWATRYAILTEAQREQLRTRLAALAIRPTVSILLASQEASEEQLVRTLQGLERQVYPEWELCLAEETASPVLRRLTGSLGGSGRLRWAPGRDALVAARGDLVARLEPGDVLAEHALLAVVEAVVTDPGLCLVTTDSDVGEDGGRLTAPAFKPEWSPERLRSWDYVGRAAFYRTERVRAAGGWGSGPVAQHALTLTYASTLTPAQIRHIPAVLLHARPEAEPTPEAGGTGVRALQAYLDATGTIARAEPGRRPRTYHVHYALPDPAPLVTVIIPTRDRLALLRRCIQSLDERTAYRPLELIVVDNESHERRTLRYLAELESSGAARVLRYPHPFNYAAMNNLAAQEARGTALCLLNNDVEAIDGSWLTEMVGLALQPGVGAVGAKLLYSDDRVQHAGTVAGLFGVAAHSYRRETRQADGYLLELQTTREVAAVTAACMVLRKDLFLEVGGLDQSELRVAFNDVDLCFKLLRAGRRNLWTPHAELHHRESASRGSDERGADRRRFLEEEAVMHRRWPQLIAHDPYHSPNLSLDSNLPRPAWPPRVTWPWTTGP
jgi:GT2 family glycosyltransferase